MNDDDEVRTTWRTSDGEFKVEYEQGRVTIFGREQAMVITPSMSPTPELFRIRAQRGWWLCQARTAAEALDGARRALLDSPGLDQRRAPNFAPGASKSWSRPRQLLAPSISPFRGRPALTHPA